jgi:hypothetical protein
MGVLLTLILFVACSLNLIVFCTRL